MYHSNKLGKLCLVITTFRIRDMNDVNVSRVDIFLSSSKTMSVEAARGIQRPELLSFVGGSFDNQLAGTVIFAAIAIVFGFSAFYWWKVRQDAKYYAEVIAVAKALAGSGATITYPVVVTETMATVFFALSIVFGLAALVMAIVQGVGASRASTMKGMMENMPVKSIMKSRTRSAGGASVGSIEAFGLPGSQQFAAGFSQVTALPTFAPV